MAETAQPGWLTAIERRPSASLGVIDFVDISTPYTDEPPQTGHPKPRLAAS